MTMQREALQGPRINPNFIGSWTIEPLSVCEELIVYFETKKEKQNIGATSGGIELSVKNSMDISIAPNELNLSGNELFKAYIDGLFKCYKDYLLQWPFLKEMGKKLEIGRFNLQRYQTGGHFQMQHAERNSLSNLHRILAWMTYLNDVEEGGETYFSHYDLKIKPQKGLTLIWPAEWTHAHSGNLLEAGSKYIITGWMHFSE